jgi:hypothetical protein
MDTNEIAFDFETIPKRESVLESRCPEVYHGAIHRSRLSERYHQTAGAA